MHTVGRKTLLGFTALSTTPLRLKAMSMSWPKLRTVPRAESPMGVIDSTGGICELFNGREVGVFLFACLIRHARRTLLTALTPRLLLHSLCARPQGPAG